MARGHLAPKELNARLVADGRMTAGFGASIVWTWVSGTFPLT